jgi:hypothetical protein
VLANFRATITYHPLGVVGVIGPWNYPIFTPMGSIAYALAAGNAVVFKPSELTPLVGVKIVELAAKALSVPDVLQIVTGAGRDRRRAVQGRGRQAGLHRLDRDRQEGHGGVRRDLDPGADELGGKDPMIVADDADLDAAAEAAVFGALTNTGQACISIERHLRRRAGLPAVRRQGLGRGRQGQGRRRRRPPRGHDLVGPGRDRPPPPRGRGRPRRQGPDRRPRRESSATSSSPPCWSTSTTTCW